MSAYAAEIKEAVKTEAVIDGARKYGTGAAIFWSGLGTSKLSCRRSPSPENEVS